MSRAQELGVGVLLLAGAATTGFLAIQMGAVSWMQDPIEVTAQAVDVAGLQEGYVVTSQGVPVGRVGEIARVDGRVVVRLILERSAELRSDVIPRIRARSLLGEKYVELVPGRGGAELLESGDVLTPIGEQFEIDELVDLIGPLVASVDPAVLAELAITVNQTWGRDPDRLARMLADVEALLANGRRASEDLPALVEEARATLGTVDARATELESTLARADRLLGELESGGSAIPETVEEARQALASARSLMSKLDGATGDLEKVLRNLSTLDPQALEHLLRDEGIRVRFAARDEKR